MLPASSAGGWNLGHWLQVPAGLMAVGQLLGLRHCLPAQPGPPVSDGAAGSTDPEPERVSQGRERSGEVEEEKGWGGQSEQDSHVLPRLRGALASGDQLASITDFI